MFAAAASVGLTVAANTAKTATKSQLLRLYTMPKLCCQSSHLGTIPHPNQLLRISPSAIKHSQLGLKLTSPVCHPIKGIIGIRRLGEIRAASAKAGDMGNPAGLTRRCIVLDIEGTTTPISFVTDVLFPYARDNVGRHLSSTYETPETQDDIKLLRAQVEEDLKLGLEGAVPIPPDDAGKEEVIEALVANVEAMIKADRKITALKQLQGHIWRTGFQNNELEGVVFEDVPEALQRWHATGIKVGS